MSGPTPPDSPPPEVPEEFATAYREAYERALAAQSDEPTARRHVDERQDDDEDELPRRRGALRIGTHRSVDRSTTRPQGPTAVPAPVHEGDWEEDREQSRWERITRSHWFVPLLLGLLALLLVLGAYTVGRSFAARVSNDDPTSAVSPTALRSPAPS